MDELGGKIAKKEFLSGSSHGLDCLKIILESFIRAGIKTIEPGGLAFDQLIFGTKDAFRNAKTDAILQEIRDNLLVHINAESLRGAEDKILLASIEGLIKQQKDVVQQISDKLDALDPKDLAIISRNNILLIQQYNKRIGINSHIEVSADLLQKFREETQNCLKQEMLKFESDLNGLQGQLKEIQSYFHQSNQEADPLRLSKLIRSLQQDIFHEELSENVLSARNILRLINKFETIGLKLQLTVDFSEIYRYSFAFVEPRPESVFDTYIFKSSKTPLLLLPGTLRELSIFLDHSFKRVFNYREFRETLSKKLKNLNQWDKNCAYVLRPEERFMLSSASGSDYSPYGRMVKLLNDKKVIPIRTWDITKPDEQIYNKAFILMSNNRASRKELANHFDAINIAYIYQLNSIMPENNIYGHVTSSTITRRVGKELPKYLSYTNKSDFDASLLFIDSKECAFKCNFEEKFRKRSIAFRELTEHQMYNCYELLSLFDKKTDILASQLKKPNANELLKLGNYFSSLDIELQNNYDTFIHPFCDDVLTNEGENIKHSLDFAQGNQWLQQFDDSYEQLLDDITELMTHLDPLIKAFEPFDVLSKLNC